MERRVPPDKLVVKSNALRSVFAFCLLVSAALFGGKCQARPWISISSSQIEILTSNGPNEGEAALRVLQNAREFFGSGSALPVTLQQPVRVFAFQSDNEYASYRLNSNAFGHFLHSRRCDYIVLKDIKPEHYEAALHEYTHYAMRQAGLHLPTWLNEGIADLYSSLEPRGRKTFVGRLLPGRLAALEGKTSLDLKTLFAVTPNSPEYNESGKLLLFYAQSWAFTHMLALDHLYSAQFPSFLKAVSSGVPSAEALRRVYGKDLQQIQADFEDYLPRMAANTASFDFQLRPSSISPQVKPLSNEEKTLALADLLAAHPATAPEALRTLTELATENPHNPLIEERLGYAAWSMRQVDDARSYFARAVEHGSRNSDAIYRYAVMQKQAGAPDGEVAPLFERVLQLSPDFDDARFQLGLAQFNDRRFSAAVQSLSKLKTVKDEWAFAYYSVMAYCQAELRNAAEAKTFCGKAKLSAQTPDEQSQADRLLFYLEAPKSTVRHGAVLASAQPQQTDGRSGQAF